MGKPKTRPAIPGKGVATLHEGPASTWAPLEPLPSPPRSSHARRRLAHKRSSSTLAVGSNIW